MSHQERLEELEDKLKWAYCKEIGADSIIGLDCCDDYRDWLESLGSELYENGDYKCPLKIMS